MKWLQREPKETSLSKERELMNKLICSNCEKDYRETGTTYQRADGSGRVDYLCAKKKGGCGCKVKPIDVEVSDVSCVSDSVNIKGDDWVDFTIGLSGLDKAYSEQEELPHWENHPSIEKQLSDGWDKEAIDECSFKQETVVDALNAYHENPINMEGSVEYTPEHELTDSGYKVYYKNTYVVATHEELRKAFMMYCVGGLTMNQVSLELTWTREEFNAIKTAFHITKDAAPFTPYEIDQMSPDEMAEIVRIEKKRYALSKLAHSSNKDIRKEIDRHNQVDYFAKMVMEGVNSIPCEMFQEFTVENSDNFNYVVKITDEHAGLTVDSVHNKYNLNIMEDRFCSVYNYIVDIVPKGEVTILSGGDLVHGLIHGSTEKASTYVITALQEIVGCYRDLILSLINAGYSVKFAKANGSHSSLEKNKMNRTEEENLGRMLPFHLEALFANTDAFTMLKPLDGTNHTPIEIGRDTYALLGHGDEMKNVKAYAAFANSMTFRVTEFLLGHIHHYKAEELDGVLVEHTNSFCGTDQYAGKLGLLGESGFTIIKYNSHGKRVGIENITF